MSIKSDNKTTKNATVKNIERISIVLLLASVVAVCIGFAMIVLAVSEIIHVRSFPSGYEIEIAEAVKEIAEGLVLVIHYFLVAKFFVVSLKEGVPLTHEGAKEIRTIGWETIMLPIAVEVIGLIAHTGLVPPASIFSIEIYELALGVFLIQTGYVMDYGTDRIEAAHEKHEMMRYIEDHHPEIAREAMENYKSEQTE